MLYHRSLQVCEGQSGRIQCEDDVPGTGCLPQRFLCIERSSSLSASGRERATAGTVTIDNLRHSSANSLGFQIGLNSTSEGSFVIGGVVLLLAAIVQGANF